MLQQLIFQYLKNFFESQLHSNFSFQEKFKKINRTTSLQKKPKYYGVTNKNNSHETADDSFSFHLNFFVKNLFIFEDENETYEDEVVDNRNEVEETDRIVARIRFPSSDRDWNRV